MKAILILICCFIGFTFSVNPATGTYLKQKEAMVQKNVAAAEDSNDISGGERPAYVMDDFRSDALAYTDYTEGGFGIYFSCLNTDGVISYRLGYIPWEEQYEYCTVECQYGRLQNNRISKYTSVEYFMDMGQANTNNYMDKLSIKYYDAEDKLLAYSNKYIYRDEIHNSFYSDDIGR